MASKEKKVPNPRRKWKIRPSLRVKESKKVYSRHIEKIVTLRGEMDEA